MAAHLEAALAEGDAALVATALSEGNPELATVMKVMHALGLRFHAAARSRGEERTPQEVSATVIRFHPDARQEHQSQRPGYWKNRT